MLAQEVEPEAKTKKSFWCPGETVFLETAFRNLSMHCMGQEILYIVQEQNMLGIAVTRENPL